MSYIYTWTPFFIVAAVAVLLTVPWLALIALMIVLLVALAALAWAIVSVPLLISRTISHRWHGGRGASPLPAAALSAPPSTALGQTHTLPASEIVLLADPPPNGDW